MSSLRLDASRRGRSYSTNASLSVFNPVNCLVRKLTINWSKSEGGQLGKFSQAMERATSG